MRQKKFKRGQVVHIKKDARYADKFTAYGSEMYSESYKCIIREEYFNSDANEWTYTTDNTNWVHESFFYIPENRLGGELVDVN